MALTDTQQEQVNPTEHAARRIRELVAAVTSHTETATRQINALVAKYGRAEIEAELGNDAAALAKWYTGAESVVKEGSGKTLASLSTATVEK